MQRVPPRRHPRAASCPGPTGRKRLLPGGALAATLFLAPSALAQDADVARSNVVSFLTAEGADTSDPVVSQALSSLAGSAESARSSLSANGSWPDINYADVPSGSYSPSSHFSRMLTMAKAYRTPGQAHYQSSAMLAAIDSALGYINTIIYDGCPKPGNWWYWDIGIPRQLGPFLLLVDGHANASAVSAGRATMGYLVGDAPGGTGANLVWEALNHFYYAALVDDDTRLGVAATAMESVAVISEADEGIMADYSFHQHGAQLYTGGYGASFANDMAFYQLIAAGTGAELSSAGRAIIDGYVADGVRWSLYGRYFDVSVVGREVTRAGKNGGGGLHAMLMLSSLPGPRQDELIAATKMMLPEWSGFSSEYAALVTPTEASAVPAAWPSGHRHYPDSDYSVHRRPGYFASLKMLSTRMRAAELVNSEGKKSWHLSDGLLYLVQSGDEYFGNDTWPSLDWSRLPGTTVEQKSRAAGEGYGEGTRDFVGGVGDDEIGVAAMDFAANESGLTAKKSWFFFDDVIVALATDVDCATGNGVDTTVEQIPIEAGTTVTVDGSASTAADGWQQDLAAGSFIHADDLGAYLFEIGAAGAAAKTATQSGAWSDLGIGSSTTQSKLVYTVSIDHGVDPSGDRYAYALLPGTSATDVASWAAAPTVEILAQTSELHAVRQAGSGVLEAVFWQAGAVGPVTASAPCVLVTHVSGGDFLLAGADPSHATSTVTITVDEPLTEVSLDDGMQSTKSATETTVTLSLSEGRRLLGRFTRDGYVGPDGGQGGQGASAGGSAAGGSSSGGAPVGLPVGELEEDEGCGCALPGRARTFGGALAWLGGLIVAATRRQRRPSTFARRTRA